MKISARNQLPGTVSAVRPGAVNDEVELTLAGGARVTAIVTHGSVEALPLRVGHAAFALVKASNVMLATDLAGVRLSARNQWAATVRQITPGAVNAEVALDLDGGLSLVSVITLASAQALELAPGARVTALVKASDMVLGVTV
jgi:molybdate transport system regulatory protein